MRLLTLFGLLLLLNFVKSLRQLKFVQAIWRHGDRAPYGLPYPNDKNDESKWPRGWLQLSTTGMKQMRQLGEFFRQRYAPWFVSLNFNATEVHIRSSEADRALSSAQAMLSGFFPPSKNEEFEAGLSWQPIPIHSSGPIAHDPLLKPTNFQCPKFSQIKNTVAAKNIERVTNNYKQLFDFLGNVTGVGSGVTFDTVVELYDIVREVHNNLTQPDWVYKTWPEYGGNTTLNLILEIQRLWRFYEFSHHPSAYLRGGLLLGDWLHRASNVSCGRYKNPSKMVLYSSHEGTMHSLLHNLEVSNNNLVPYSACIIMEIYKNEHDHLEIELLYRTLQNGGRTEVIVPKNCTSPCPLTKFFDIYKSKAIFTIEKLYEECGLKYCEQGHLVDEFDD
ncbi:histidine phosphatase superfamily (branch 2) domain-containing protein [Ditylenchus destructor]|nr:histidine phosphatase superfamily (branch 2) domain-containing protein [Ditylenchus destructor]